MILHELHFQPLSFLWRMGDGGAENKKLLNKAWCFWWSAPVRGPTKTHLFRTKGTPVSQGSSNYVRNWGQRSNIRTERLSSSFLVIYMDFRLSVPGTSERTICTFFFSIILQHQSAYWLKCVLLENTWDHSKNCSVWYDRFRDGVNHLFWAKVL